MSHEGGPEQPQRTVAELLAKYGAVSGERPRRRRRRADDPSDTGAQQIIERVMSESGEMPVIREDTPPPERTSHRRSADGYQRQDTPPRRRAPQPGQQSSQRLQRPLPPQPSQQLPRPQPAPQPPAPGPGPGQQTSNRVPGMGGPTTPVRGTQRQPQPPQPSQQLPRPQPSQRMPMPPGGTRDRSGVQPSVRSRLDGDTAPPPPPPMAAPPAEATTEEMPRVPGVPSRIPVDGSMTGRRPMPPGADSRTRISPVYPRDPYSDPPAEEDDYRSAYPESDPDERYDSAEYENLLDEDDRGRDRRDRDDFDELDDLEGDDLDEDRQRSPAGEWLVMIGQLALGVIGGAAVWLGFNWLWGFLPQAALVVALVVIVGLVLIVRKIRRAEDLQTTVLAVLVGLVVTVSPAALLLLNR
jgi:hypothetical protein